MLDGMPRGGSGGANALNAQLQTCARSSATKTNACFSGRARATGGWARFDRPLLQMHLSLECCGYRKVDTTANQDAFNRKVDMKTRPSVSRPVRLQPACDSLAPSGSPRAPTAGRRAPSRRSFIQKRESAPSAWSSSSGTTNCRSVRLDVTSAPDASALVREVRPRLDLRGTPRQAVPARRLRWSGDALRRARLSVPD